MNARRRWPRALLALGFYVVVVVWLTWPLAEHLATRLPATHAACRFDALHLVWALSHESHALTTQPSRFAEGNIFYPTPHALYYGQAAYGALPYFMPTYLLSGNPTLAMNIVFLFSIAATAWTLHLVAARWSGSELGGFVAAWTFLTTRWVLWEFIPSAPTFAVLLYFPLLISVAALGSSTFRQALRLLPLVVLQCLTDVAYFAAAVFAPLGFLAVLRLLLSRTRKAGLHLLGVLALAGVVLFPAYLGYIVVGRENPLLSEQTVWRGLAEVPTVIPWGLLGYLAPTSVQPVVLLVILLGAVAFLATPTRRHDAVTRRAWTHALLWASFGTFISLTPIVRVLGFDVSLPQHLLAEWLPLYQRLRVPARLGVAGLMGLALLAGLAFAECMRWLGDRIGRRAIAGPASVLLALLLAVVVYAQYASDVGVSPSIRRRSLPSRYPLQEAINGDSPLVGLLRAPGGPLLELPSGSPEQFFAADARAMYRSIFHWRPLVNGYSGYWPADFPDRMWAASDNTARCFPK